MSIESIYEPQSAAIGASRSSTLLRNVLRLLWVGAWVFLAAMVITLLVSLLANSGAANLKEQFFKDVSPLSGIILSSGAALFTAVLLIILRQLSLICGTLMKGDPFVPKNAKRLQIIWIAVAAGEIFRYLLNAGLNLMLAARASVESTTIMEITIRPYIWFFVLVLIVLSEVFREGARLRQEQKFTV